MSILMIDLVVPNGWTRQKLVHMKRFHDFFFQANFSIFTYISVSSHCVPFIFETCQTFAGISTMIEQFHDFLKFTFGAFCNLAQLCPVSLKILTQLKHPLSMKMKCRHPLNSENFHYNFLIELPPLYLTWY